MNYLRKALKITLDLITILGLVETVLKFLAEAIEKSKDALEPNE